MTTNEEIRGLSSIVALVNSLQTKYKLHLGRDKDGFFYFWDANEKLTTKGTVFQKLVEVVQYFYNDMNITIDEVEPNHFTIL